MVEKIAYRVSAAILLMTALAIVAMFLVGLTRADAGNSSVPSKTMVAENVTPEPVAQKMSRGRTD